MRIKKINEEEEGEIRERGAWCNEKGYGNLRENRIRRVGKGVGGGRYMEGVRRKNKLS